MTYQLILPGSFTDDDLPILQPDPILTKGSIWLIEPGHPANPWPPGVPAHTDSVPNLVPAFDAPDGLAVPPMRFQANGLNGANGLLERTGKGGLHVIVSQTQQVVLDTPNQFYAGVAEGSIISGGGGTTTFRTWLYNTGYAHAMYISVWSKFTRIHKNNANQTWFAQVASGTSTTGRYNVALNAKGGSDLRHRPDVSNMAGFQKDVSLGYKLNATASTGPSGTLPTSIENVVPIPFYDGGTNVVNTYMDAKGASPSMVFYRAYLEDLTVSGRTWDQVNAIDNALFQKECMTSGGRYYGDTHTDPTTIP